MEQARSQPASKPKSQPKSQPKVQAKPAAQDKARDNPYLRPFGKLSMGDLERQIADTEIAIAENQQTMADPAAFKNPSRGKSLQAESDALAKKLKQLEAEYFARES